PYSVFAGAAGTELSAVEETSSRACPLVTLAGVVVPRAAKTSFARSMSGVLKVPSSILKSSFWEGTWRGNEISRNLSEVKCAKVLTRRRLCPPPCLCPWLLGRTCH
ncbi:hypothetical protein N306_01937, partial [Opisthocomus hoazin]